MLRLGGVEVLLLSVVWTLICLTVVYWVIRLAVRHALQDVQGSTHGRQVSPSPNSPLPPGL